MSPYCMPGQKKRKADSDASAASISTAASGSAIESAANAISSATAKSKSTGSDGGKEVKRVRKTYTPAATVFCCAQCNYDCLVWRWLRAIIMLCSFLPICDSLCDSFCLLFDCLHSNQAETNCLTLGYQSPHL